MTIAPASPSAQPIVQFALVNEDPRISSREMALIALAIEQYMTNRVCPVWGFMPVQVRSYSPTQSNPALSLSGVAVCRIVPNIKGAPADALGWHDEVRGKPVLFIETDPIFANGGVTLFDPHTPNRLTVASVIFHEVAETRGDITVNRWVDDPSHGALVETAEELCDACEDAIVPVTVTDPQSPAPGTSVIVGLSSFLYPAWFDAQNKVGPFDEGRVCHAAFALSALGGGYKIVRRVVRGSETTAAHRTERVLGAHYPLWRLAMKASSNSRSTRRLHGNPRG